MPEVSHDKATSLALLLYTKYRFYNWPRYYRTLLLCRNSYYYTVRFRQVIFCVVNRIKFTEFIDIITTLNPYVTSLNDRLYKKLNDLFHYVVSKGLEKPREITSYNYRLGTLTTINGHEIFLDEFVDEPFDDPVDHLKCDRYLNQLGVKHLISFDRLDW